ncbi:MAG: mycoredoxin [Actinomycetota bacterium]
MSAAHDLPATGTINLFSTPWCGYCRGLKKALDRDGIGYNEIDIEQHQGGADYVMSVNGGNQTVPTVVFPDGTSATNPSLAEVRLRLA